MCLRTRGLVFTPLQEHLGPAGKRAALPSLGHTGNQKPGDLMGALKITPRVCGRCAAPAVLSERGCSWEPSSQPLLFRCGHFHADTYLRRRSCCLLRCLVPFEAPWGTQNIQMGQGSLASSFCSRRASMMAPGSCIQAMGLFTQKAPEIDQQFLINL